MRALRDLVDELLQAKVKTKLFGGEHSPKLGRLALFDRLGAGAMGTVFAAYDPRLDRKVAVKVLGGGASAQRVLGEARALAKLAHPNVVAVHDAEELDGLVYIVMELAPGVSLRTWMTGERDWRAVVRVMREAGLGIAAAHAAGLVHRDIKPDNILVGEDRTRVVDFGLANAFAADDDTSAGTPLYMAPEVLGGSAATAASDQFSFAVTLFEALYGRRPHGALSSSLAQTAPAGATAAAARPTRAELLAELRIAALAAANEPPPRIGGSGRGESGGGSGSGGSGRATGGASKSAANRADTPAIDRPRVPAWLHAVVARGLAAEPADRFPSMDAFVAALRRQRRRTQVLAIAAAALVCGGVLGAVVVRSQAGGDPCAGGPARTATVWPPSQRARVETALGHAAWTSQTLAAIDAKASAWQTSYRRVCEATRVRGGQSDTLFDLRMHCLDRSLDRFGAVVGELAEAKLAAVRIAAPTAIGELAIESCEALTSPGELAMPTDPAQRERAKQIEHGLSRAWAAFALGLYDSAREQAAALDPLVAQVQSVRLRGEVLVLAASVEARAGDPQRARELLDRALETASEAGAPELELDVWSRRLRAELFAGDPAKVLEWATFARAAAKRAGREGAEIESIIGEAMRGAGKLGPAREHLERALASKDPLRPEQRAVIEMNLGSIELAAGDSAAALVTLQRARDRVLSAFGDGHPELALYADKLAAAHRARGALRDALKLHARSLELRTAAFGLDDRAIATSLFYRAQTEIEAGDIDGAKLDLERASAIREKVYGATSPRLGELLVLAGDIAQARGIHELAQQRYNEAVTKDPRLELAARLAAASAPVALDAIPPLDPDELLSIDRVNALAARVSLLIAASRQPEAIALAKDLHARLKPGMDPAFAGAIATALAATGDRAGAAAVYATAAKSLGNEPSRAALRIFIGLARSLSADPADSDAAQAARTAISLYQAMPQLEREQYEEMWTLSRQKPTP